MAKVGILIQLDGRDNVGPDVIFNVFYSAIDSVQQLSISRCVADVMLPVDTPWTWKALLINAIVSDAAIAGITLVPSQIRWLHYEPGDHRYTQMSAAWTKDITKTNIGTALVNVYSGQNGEVQIVDFGGFSQYRLICGFNKIGTGNLTHGIYEFGVETNKMELVYTGAAGEGASDSGWVVLPAWAKGDKVIKPMAKSSVASDDPIYRSVVLYLR